MANRSFQSDIKERIRKQKIITYARNGIPEYWIIDLVNKKLITHTQVKNSSYDRVKEYQTGTVSSLTFPNIEINLDRLLLF